MESDSSSSAEAPAMSLLSFGGHCLPLKWQDIVKQIHTMLQNLNPKLKLQNSGMKDGKMKRLLWSLLYVLLTSR